MTYRYIKLNDSERLRLEETYRTDSQFRVRCRAQALLLSNKGYNIGQLAELFEVRRDTITAWFNKWEKDMCLQDAAKSGRPRIFTEREEKKL